MENDMDEIKDQWKKAKLSVPKDDSIDSLIKKAESRRKSSIAFHYGNIVVLSVVVVVLVMLVLLFFPFRETISRIGVACMVGGIVVRIIIEYYSSRKATKIDLTSNATSATDETLKFYEFRKKVHGPITFSIVALYTVGLGLLTPEFYKHMGAIIFLFDGLYCISGIFMIWQIRKGIRKELQDLNDIIKIRSQLNG